MTETFPYPDRIKFRLFADPDRGNPFTFTIEWSGREISVDPGAWVDIEVDNGDGTPAEVHIGPQGEVSVYGRHVVVTDETGEERLY